MRTLAFVHGAYYLVTGLWPLLSIDTFQAVTGDKTDLWLVKTVGLLVSVAGLALLSAGRRRCWTVELLIQAVGAALALAGVDLVYSLRGVISAVYLLDAPVELALAAAWGIAWRRRSAGLPKVRAPSASPASPGTPPDTLRPP